MNRLYRRKTANDQKGQVLVTFVVIFPVLLLFIGLALDLGFAYVTKTALSKAADAAHWRPCAISVRVRAKPPLSPSARSMSTIKPRSVPAALSQCQVSITNNSNNNPVVTVGATTTINTFSSASCRDSAR